MPAQIASPSLVSPRGKEQELNTAEGVVDGAKARGFIPGRDGLRRLQQVKREQDCGRQDAHDSAGDRQLPVQAPHSHVSYLARSQKGLTSISHRMTASPTLPAMASSCARSPGI